MKAPRLLAIPAAVGLWALSASAADLSIANTQAAGFDDPTPAQPVSVNIGTTRGQQALVVFQTAAAMWGASVRSAVPIVIDSQFNSAATDSVFACTSNSTVLAYTSPSGYVTSSSFPNANAGYDFALANALSGTDLSQNGTQFQVNINGDLGTSACAFPAAWYFGLDSAIPAGQVSLFTTLNHEFGHGLGYSSLVNPRNGAAESADLSIFDFHIFDVAAGVPWTSETAAKRQMLAATPSGLAFDGPAVRADIPTYLAPPPELFTHVGGATTQLDFTKGDFSGPLVASAPVPVVAAIPLDACSDLTNSGQVAGKYALVQRSYADAGVVCTFISKAERAADAGAAGIIVFDTQPEGLVTMAGTPALTTPAVFISNDAGVLLQNELGQGVVTANFGAGAQVSNTDPSGTRVLLYTPSSVSAGSSVIHWNSNSYPRTLNMEFAIQPDIRLDMDFTPDVMSDLGWSVVQGLSVSVVKLLEPLVVAGKQTSYIIAVLNRRSTAINSVTLDLTPPSSSTVVSTLSSPAGCSSGFPCTFGPMQAGDVVLVVATLQVAATASGSFPVSVTLTPSSASAADSLTATTTQTVATGGDVQVAVTGPASVIPGTTATLVTTVTNAGPGTATGVVLNGAVSGSANPPTFSANNGVCTGAFPCNLGNLPPGTSLQVTTLYNVPAGFASGATFTATVTSTTQDTNPANNSASYAFSVTGKSGCSTSGEPATVLGLLTLAFGLFLRRRRES